MRHVSRILAVSVLGMISLGRAVPAPAASPWAHSVPKAAEVPWPTALTALAGQESLPKPSVSADKAKPPAKPALSEERAALRDRLRRTLALYFHQPVNTAENLPSEILPFCLAFGCDTEIRYGSSTGTAMNGIGCLCWNYPCAGYQLLLWDGQRMLARVGYGLQEQPSQLLATLAQSGVPADYEIRAGSRKATVASLVASEQLDCRSRSDQSLKLIGLAFYAENGQEWKNRQGESWSLERLVKEELNRTPGQSCADVANRLVGLSYAVQRRIHHNEPMSGSFERARDYLAEFQKHTLGLQNSDGSWHPALFAPRGQSLDSQGSLRSTGYLLEWLVLSLPEERMNDPKLARSLGWLAENLENLGSRWTLAYSTPRETDSVMHAVHALRLYDRRVFKPLDPETPQGPASSPPTVPPPATALLGGPSSR